MGGSLKFASSAAARPFLALVFVLAVCSSAKPQSVPEGIHRDAQGPSTLCGVRGSDTKDLAQQIRALPGVRRQAANTSRFEVFVAEDRLTIWVFTLPTERAYPAVTCTRLIEDQKGGWIQGRSMRCEADRQACDELFIEFQRLDDQLRQSLSR